MPVLTPTNQGLMRLALLAALAGALIAAPAGAHAKVRSSVSGQLLKVAGGSGSDRITVSCSATLVKVNGTNPRTGPDARKNSSPAASKVVMFESAIADKAFWKPLRRDRRSPSVRPLM